MIHDDLLYDSRRFFEILNVLFKIIQFWKFLHIFARKKKNDHWIYGKSMSA